MLRFFFWAALAFGVLGCEGDSIHERLARYDGREVCEATESSPSAIEEQVQFSISDSTSTWAYVLEEGEEALFSRSWLCANAVESIDIQYFIFSMDNVGLIAMDQLVKAADRGVQVRILVDDIMRDVHLEDLQAFNAHPNLEMRLYNPIPGKNIVETAVHVATDFKAFNQRMHNKTFVVDGQVCITGGRNMADEYFDYDQGYNFRDRDVLLIGQGVEDVQASFEGFWNSEWTAAIPAATQFQVTPQRLYAQIAAYACDPLNFWPEVRHKIAGIPEVIPSLRAAGKLHALDSFGFVSDEPGKNDVPGLHGGGATTDALVQIVENAKSSLLIQSPYLIVTPEGIELLTRAVERGVDVKILTNSLSSTDNLEAFNGYQRIRPELLAAGVEVFEYRPDAAIRKQLITATKQHQSDFLPVFGLHAKSMVVDHVTTVIGTFNMDPRSANLNTECISILHSAQLAAQVESILLEELLPQNAWRITRVENPDGEAGLWKNFQTWLRRVVPSSIL